MAVVSLEYFFDIVSIPAWIHFERLARLQQCNVTLDIKFRPVHAALLLTSAGNPIPYSTPALKKAYFEEQRLLSRICGASINTSPEIIDNILSGLSNFILPQCALHMVASMYSHRDFLALSRTFWRRIWIENKPMQTEDDLLEALNDSGIPSTSMGIISDNKWSAQLNECHDQALDSKCFGIPWTLLRFEDGTSKVFFGSDRWPLICSHLKIPYKLFGDIKL